MVALKRIIRGNPGISMAFALSGVTVPSTAFPEDAVMSPGPAPFKGYSTVLCRGARNNTLRNTIGAGVWIGVLVGGPLGALYAGPNGSFSMMPILAVTIGAGLGTLVGSMVANHKAPECSTTTYPMVGVPAGQRFERPVLFAQAEFLF